MKNLIRLGLMAFICMAVSLLTINNTFAQGQGKGKGKGLLENRGIQNGQGFTTGQGHLNGNSAVDLPSPEPDCIDEKIAWWATWYPWFVSYERIETGFTITEYVEPLNVCGTFVIQASINPDGTCSFRIVSYFPIPCGF